ncbi:SulP family inorganic anion transporter [Saccharicrinis aurantiacus]|uniref:SulP family inorganic anion transporter n=1 Tax=Saccharicrinis aurantiacus TaxID=1849719 RepID=UPI00083917CB|nr:SulP family inorganic anion transporter [Saccharicrinis aurantiacus]
MKTIKFDAMASIVVFLVALPLCLGIALASGAPLISGLITGIIGGIVVGWLSDSKVSVSGPAAGLTVIVFSAIATIGSFQAFLVAVVLSGVIQLILGYLKAGVIGHFFPSSVIMAMLTAIGITIIISQIPHAIGYDIVEQMREHGLVALAHSFEHAIIGATIVSIISLVILLVWDTPKFKNHKVLKLIPAPLVVVFVGVLCNLVFKKWFPAFYIDTTHLVALPEFTSAASVWNEMNWPDFKGLLNTNVYIAAITIAIIGSLESLLSLEAADKLDPAKRISSPNQELKAQGIGNIIAGLLGGIPLTAVIVRSSANINAGAKSKKSAILHGVLLLIAVLFCGSVLNYIPLAALAAILIHVGLKLNKISTYKKVIAGGADQYIPFFTTIAVVLATDLLKGIIVGITVGFIFMIKSNFRSAILKANVNNNYLIKMTNNMYFFNKAQLRKALQKIPANSNVLIDGTHIDFIDHDVEEIIEDYIAMAADNNITVTLKKSTTANISLFKLDASA